MVSESIFTIQHFKIKVKELNKPIYLLPFGDVHRFTKLCDKDKWHKFLSWAEAKENAYFLGMGDYDDFMSFSERRLFQEGNFHETTQDTIKDVITSHCNKFISEIKFMQGKIIGMLEGNHYGKFQSGMTTTQEMCRRLKCAYLGCSSFIRLSFEFGNKRSAIDIWCHHGKGASRLVGGSLNTVEQMESTAHADIFLMGHDHKKSVGLKTRLRLNPTGGNIRLSQQKVLLARTGSFMRGYVPDVASYVARGMLTPTDLGVVKIELTPKREQKNKEDTFFVDVHASI